MELLTAENIVKDYNNHRALNDVSISVSEGKVFGLLGPNGAGKTTLIRIINQIIAQDSGIITFNGSRLEEEHASLIGYLPEERGLYKKMKVGEQALYLAQLKGMSKKDAKSQLKYWFDKFEIGSWWNKNIEELSKGMQQKVQFIVTILHKPKLLIFDEPFSGFDPINANIIKEEMLQLKKDGATIILSTHNMNSVEELCDDIALINKSQLILEGSTADVRKKFSSNKYEVKYSGYYDKILNTLTSSFKILDQKQENDETTITIELVDDSATNDILRHLMNSGNITSFTEVIPGMNEIFINAVEAHK